MAAFLTCAVWFSGLSAIWWLWASLLGPAEPARSTLNAIFVVLALLMAWYLLYSPLPDFLHFGPHLAHGFLGYEPKG